MWTKYVFKYREYSTTKTVKSFKYICRSINFLVYPSYSIPVKIYLVSICLLVTTHKSTGTWFEGYRNINKFQVNNLYLNVFYEVVLAIALRHIYLVKFAIIEFKTIGICTKVSYNESGITSYFLI